MAVRPAHRRPPPVTGARGRPRSAIVGPARRGDRVGPAELGADRPRPQRPRLPARVPADRQLPRRRGPHPGRVRPGLPLAAHLPARHVRGLAAPHHHQPVPGLGPPQAEDPVRRSGRRLGGAAAEPAGRPPRRPSPTPDSTTTSPPPSPPCRPSSGPRSCSATSKVSRTRRSPRSSTPRSAPSGAGSTAVARSCAPRWLIVGRPASGALSRGRGRTGWRAGRSRSLGTGVREAFVKARSCAELAELRSAFVDGALGDA